MATYVTCSVPVLLIMHVNLVVTVYVVLRLCVSYDYTRDRWTGVGIEYLCIKSVNKYCNKYRVIREEYRCCMDGNMSMNENLCQPY